MRDTAAVPAPPAGNRLLRRTRTAFWAAAFVAAAAAGAVALEEPKKPAGGGRTTVDDMDLILLQRNLLKIYVCEKESAINEERLNEYKLASETMGEYGKETLDKPSPEQLEDMKKRHKFIFHYLLMEKTNAVQVIHIVDRILGTDVHLEGEGRPGRAILEKLVEFVEIPKGTDLVVAAKKIGEILGCPVEVELPPLQNFTIWFTLERTTGEAIIKQVCSQLPLEWRIEGGVLYLRHMEFMPPDAGPDDEEDL